MRNNYRIKCLFTSFPLETNNCTHRNMQWKNESLKNLLDTSQPNNCKYVSPFTVQVVHSTKTKSKLRYRLPCHWQKTTHRHDIVHTIDFLRVLRHTASATIGTGSCLHPAPPSIHRFSSATQTIAMHCIISRRIASYILPRHKQIKTEKAIAVSAHVCVCGTRPTKGKQPMNRGKTNVAPVNRNCIERIWRKCILMASSCSLSLYPVSLLPVAFFVGLRFYCATIKVKFYWVQDHKNRIEHKDKLSVQRTHIESCRRTNVRTYWRSLLRLLACSWKFAIVTSHSTSVCIVHTTVRHNWTHFSLSVNARRTVLPNNWKNHIHIHIFTILLFSFIGSLLSRFFSKTDKLEICPKIRHQKLFHIA